MKTKITDTSLQAYEELKKSGKLQPRENKVLLAIIQLNGATDKQIAAHLGWEINQVTGRRNSLEKKGMVFSKRKVKQLNRMVYFWEYSK